MSFHENAFKAQPKPQTTTNEDKETLTTRFIPPTPSTTPSDLFVADQTHDLRYVHKRDSKQILIYTAGASVREGVKEGEAAAGFAFVVCPPSLVDINSPGIVISERLEQHGPFDDDGVARPQTQTASCASIRAVIGALQYRKWPEEVAGYNKIIIATHDENLVDGIVHRVEKWKADGWITKAWKTRPGKPLKNSDMWEMLATGLEMYKERGVTVEFWKIEKAQNSLAAEEAKKVCDVKEASLGYVRLV